MRNSRKLILQQILKLCIVHDHSFSTMFRLLFVGFQNYCRCDCLGGVIYSAYTCSCGTVVSVYDKIRLFVFKDGHQRFNSYNIFVWVTLLRSDDVELLTSKVS